MKKRILQKSALVITALVLASGLLLGQSFSVAADEETSAQDGVVAEEMAAVSEAGSEDSGHDSFSSEMLSAARERFGLNKRSRLRSAALSSWEHSGKILEYASMPFTGKANIAAFHVAFQDQSFVEGDNEEALQKAIGIDLEGDSYPSLYSDQYSNVSGYYQRASYGKLSIAGDTYTYQAKKAKADYKDSVELCKEIMDEMDDEIDFSRYDADGDGRIDCLYFHIPYDPEDEWNSTWWPNCSTFIYQEDMEYDGVQAASRVILSRKLNDEEEDGIRTLIHETGHAMGFPDYYSFDKTPDPAGGSNQLTGTLTFDMMDINVGDHNGFSKWLAGWLTESDVTLVNANEYGVTATRGGQNIGTIEEDGSITLDLSSYDTETVEETGGIIVVGNNVQNPFSNYFLIQYDTFAGNQKVYYGNDKPLPSGGFRVFRVQAELDEYGQMKRNNTYFPLYDKLIELVDPDYKSDHTLAIGNHIPNGFAADGYTCMFYGGSSLTPTTGPSTNFRENINIGFTGISIEFLESGPQAGKLRISYSEKDKPIDEPLDIQLIDGVAAPGEFKVTLKGNRDLVFGIFGSQGVSASVKEGEEFLATDPMRQYDLDGDTITTTFHFDTDILTKDRTVVVRCREGAFDIGKDDEWSPPFEFELPISPDLTDISESGYIDGTAVENKGHVVSVIQQAEDGSYFFYGYTEGFLPRQSTEIYKYTFTDADPTNVTQELLAEGSEERAEAVRYINSIYNQPETEGVAILPENAQLGDYPQVLDVVKIGDYYYAASFREPDYTFTVPNRLAVSKLDGEGNLLEQIVPAGDEIRQDPGTSIRVRILEGPGDKLAVVLFNPFQDRTDYLTGHMATFFFDQDLGMISRLDNYSTGCGTWLPDGRYITFGQRVTGTSETTDAGIPRSDMICYDITTVIDPVEYQYTAESEEGEDTPIWISGSEEDLLFVAHRSIDDETAFEHFIGVQVDGKDLTEKDYTATRGSVHIALHPAYLATLSEGPHTLTILFDDGKADVAFTIQKDKPAPALGPDTGDHSQALLWVVIMAAALCAIMTVVTIYVRKQKK